MDTVIRVIVIYLVIMIGLRILGKREFGQLSPLELVALLMIPELVSASLNLNQPSLTNGIVAVVTLFCLVFLTSAFMHLSKKVEVAIAGEPVVLIANGELLTKPMNTERVTPDEVFSEMHKAGVDSLDQVKWAILESDGKIAIVPSQATSQSAAQEGGVGKG